MIESDATNEVIEALDKKLDTWKPTYPAWCDPALSREERINSVRVDFHPCPICQESCGYAEWRADRYGFGFCHCRCDDCELVFNCQPPSPAWYANFYASGTYRKLVSAYHGRDVMATIEQEQEAYAIRLSKRLPKLPQSFRILDAGGSTGTVSKVIAQAKGGFATVLDPSPEHSDSPFTEYEQGSLETWEPRHKYNLVLLCQTIDHLLEPRLCLEKIRGLLASDGLFFVDILDVEQEVAGKGWQQTLKIDHPFYFSDKSARLLLAATGFEIVDSWESAKNHFGYLCKGRV